MFHTTSTSSHSPSTRHISFPQQSITPTDTGLLPALQSYAHPLTSTLPEHQQHQITTLEIVADHPQPTPLSAIKQPTTENTPFSRGNIPPSHPIRKKMFPDYTSTDLSMDRDSHHHKTQTGRHTSSPDETPPAFPSKRYASPPTRSTTDPPTKKTRLSTKKSIECSAHSVDQHKLRSTYKENRVVYKKIH